MGREIASAGSGTLVGRRQELRAIEVVLNALNGGQRQCLQVVGEPGIGKTRLLRELADSADGRAYLVLSGRGTEFEQELPFGVFVDALDDYLGTLNPRELERLGAERRAEVAAVFPALADLAGGDAPRAHLEAERYRTHRAVRALLERLAVRVPLVLALDDLHWADEASVELVCHLLRHPPNGAALLVLAYRPAQVASALVQAAEQSRREGFGSLLELEPLAPEEAGALLGDLETRRREELYRESGGNPFYLEQLARAGRGGGVGAATTSPDVPQAVAVALGEELDALSPAALVALHGGAVAGEPFDVDLAAIAAGVDGRALLTALDEAIERDLVRSTQVPRRFRFRHPIVRGAVYESAPGAWRLAARARVAHALAERGSPAPARAHHVALAAERADEDAIAVLTEAGRSTSARAPGTAARWFQSAMRLLPEGDDRQFELLVSTATAHGASGRLIQSRDALLELLRALPPEASEVRARIAAFIARIEHPIGNHGEARAMIVDALDGLPDPRSPAAVGLMIELAHDHFFLSDFEGMLARATEALVAARELGDPLLVAAATADIGMACQNMARVPEAQAACDEATAIVDRLSDDQCAPLLETFWWLGWCEQAIERFEASARHMQRGIDLSRASGQGYNFVTMLESLAVPLGWQGRLAEAAESAEEATEAAELSGTPQFVAWAEMIRCWLAYRSGDAREAIIWGERAKETVGRLPDNVFSGLADAHLGGAYLEAGEPGRALAHLLAAGDAGAPLEHSVRCWWEVLVTRAQLGTGHVDEARAWAERATESAKTMGLPARLGWARHARAAVLLADGDATAAAVEARESVALCSKSRDPIGAARARVLLGQALAAAGQPAEAGAELEHARVDMLAAGAGRYADEAAHELRRLGRRVPRTGGRGTASTGIASLSARGREIAELVAAGQTNKEIAAELFLAP